MKRIISLFLLLTVICASALTLTSCKERRIEDVDAKLSALGFTEVEGANAEYALRATINNFISLGKLDSDVYEEYRDKIRGGTIYERTSFFAYVIEFTDDEHLSSFVGRDNVDTLESSGYIYGNVLITTNSLAVVNAIKALD